LHLSQSVPSGTRVNGEVVKEAAAAGAVRPHVVAAYVSRGAFEQEAVVEGITPEEAADERAAEQQLGIAVGRS
jgi:hypothetical protein